ncbi:MAG: acetylornithine/succinylornithine family transaminase [Clostridiales bacterium]|nr:acetylornithine/succinylornithine family transaminase [Clostridiales bacterium]
MTDLVKNDGQYIANTYARFNLQIKRGKGAIFYDFDGKKYIDLTSGIGVNSFGVSDKIWQKAVKKQLKTLQHTSNLYYTKPCVDLAKLLCEKTGLKKVFFANSGAEANECAIKTARKYAVDKKGEEYFNIITLKDSFHGRTITTLSATGQDHYHELFNPLTTGFLYAEKNFESVEKLVKENKVAGIMLEIIQGEGGVIPLDKEFLTKVQELCKKEDILLIIDEVQTGNGRTGKLYAYMNYGLSPDIVTTAKGLGGGLPIGACMFNEKTEKVLGYGEHGSTFGGNPVSSSGAVSILERLTEEFLQEVNKKSKIIFDFFKDKTGVKSITGLGLMIGIKTVKPVKEVIKECMASGVLCLSAKDKLRLLPPLNIKEKDLIKALSVIEKALG